VCDLETSRIGAPYIYIYDISNLRVNALKVPGTFFEVALSDPKKLQKPLKNKLQLPARQWSYNARFLKTTNPVTCVFLTKYISIRNRNSVVEIGTRLNN